MVRMTTLPAAPARRVQTNGPVAVAAAAAAPINQVRRVNRAHDPPPAPRAGLPPCSSLRSVILSSLRLMMLLPAAGRAGAASFARNGSGTCSRPRRVCPVLACRFARCQADLPTVARAFPRDGTASPELARLRRARTPTILAAPLAWLRHWSRGEMQNVSDDARLVFSRAEYEGRLRAVRQEMAARRIDVLLVDETEHLAYLAGWHASGSRYHGCLLPSDGDPVMVFRRLDEPAFLERSWLRDRVCFPDTEDPVEAVVRTITARGWAAARLGVETDSHYLTVPTYESLPRGLPRATLRDFAMVLRELRLRKSPREIEYLRQAAGIADCAMRNAVAAVGESLSEREAAIAASQTFLRLGADTARTGPITAGRRSGTLHGLLGDHRLSRGDLLHMELVPSVNGYSARLMRPTVIGPPSTEQADT